MTEEIERFYVCKRVEDIPDLKDDEAVKGNCETCHTPIWHKSWAPTCMPKICWQCAKEQVANMPLDEELVILPGHYARLQ